MKLKVPAWHRLHSEKVKTDVITAADKSGLPPGVLIHVGEFHQSDSHISVVTYNQETLLQEDRVSLDELPQAPDLAKVTWINIDGLSDIDVIEKIGIRFGIDHLILEDILSTHQRPKLEEFDNFVCLIVKGVMLDSDAVFKPRYEQISLLLLEHYVISFKEKPGDVFKPVIHRLKNRRGRLRQKGCDYLAYALLDAIVDQYIVVESSIDSKFDSLEENLITHPGPLDLEQILLIRRELIEMKRNLTPLRQLMVEINRSDTNFIDKKNLRYYADVYDHVLRVLDSIESFRERISALQDLYLSSISNKMNETMKVLTIFASIFIPLTFIAGIYGMNFEHMPELKWRWGYPSLLLIFIAISVGLIFFFRKKKWL